MIKQLKTFAPATTRRDTGTVLERFAAAFSKCRWTAWVSKIKQATQPVFRFRWSSHVLREPLLCGWAGSRHSLRTSLTKARAFAKSAWKTLENWGPWLSCAMSSGSKPGKSCFGKFLMSSSLLKEFQIKFRFSNELSEHPAPVHAQSHATPWVRFAKFKSHVHSDFSKPIGFHWGKPYHHFQKYTKFRSLSTSMQSTCC